MLDGRNKKGKNMKKIGFVILVLLLLAIFASVPKNITLGMTSETAKVIDSKESGSGDVEIPDSFDAVTEMGSFQHSGSSSLKAISINSLSIDVAGNATYTIANGTFILNETIIVKENAKLIIENAVVKFNCSSSYIIETYDNASVTIKNATIYRISGYAYLYFTDFTKIAIENSCLRQVYMYLYDNSNASIENSTLNYSLYMYSYSKMSITDCRAYSITAYSHSTVSVDSCSFSYLYVYDSASVLVSDSVISSEITMEFDRDSTASLSFPHGLINHWNLYDDNSVATGYINLTLHQTKVYLWSLSISDTSNISVINSQLDSLYAYTNSTISIDHSSLNYLGAYGFSNTSIVDSVISQRIYLEFWYDSNLSLTLPQGHVTYWNLYANNSITNAYIDLTSRDTFINAWYIYIYRSSITLTNSKVDYICSYYNSSIAIQGSIMNGLYNYGSSILTVSSTTLSYLYTYDLSKAQVETSTLRNIYAYANSSISVESSQVDYLNVFDYATISIKDSIVRYKAGMSFLENSDVSFDTLPIGNIHYWNLYENATVGTAYINLTIIDTLVRGWGTITVSNTAKLSLDNCVLESLYLYGNSTVALSDSLVDYLYAYDYANTLLTNSAVTYGFYISFRSNSNVSITSLHSSRIGYWNLYTNETVTRAYVNCTISNSWVNAWSINAYDSSVISVQGSTLDTIYCYGSSALGLTDSTINNVYGYDFSKIEVENCTISYLGGYSQSVMSVNGSIIRYGVYCYDNSKWTIKDSSIQSRLYLEFEETSQVSDIFSPKGLINRWSPNENATATRIFINVNLLNTTVNAWRFYIRAFSTVSFNNSSIEVLYTYNLSVTTLRNCTVETLYTYGASQLLVDSIFEDQSSMGYLYAYDESSVVITKSSVAIVYAYQYSYIELVGSFYGTLYLQDNARALVRWFLEVHVVDSIGQDVPAADVLARYANGTLAGSKTTDPNGIATLILSEKTMNATYEYPFGSYTARAVYGSHIKETTVDMIKNRQIILSLQDFTIPEIPLFVIVPLLMFVTLLMLVAYRKKIWQTRKA